MELRQLLRRYPQNHSMGCPNRGLATSRSVGFSPQQIMCLKNDEHTNQVCCVYEQKHSVAYTNKSTKIVANCVTENFFATTILLEWQAKDTHRIKGNKV
eukprot:5205117-Amphidinium_carterae.1